MSTAWGLRESRTRIPSEATALEAAALRGSHSDLWNQAQGRGATARLNQRTHSAHLSVLNGG